MKTPDMEVMLTVAETAKLLSCSVQCVTRLIQKGRLPALDLGTGKRHCYRVKPKDVAKLKAKPIESPAAPPPKQVRYRRSSEKWPFPRLLG